MKDLPRNRGTCLKISLKVPQNREGWIAPNREGDAVKRVFSEVTLGVIPRIFVVKLM